MQKYDILYEDKEWVQRDFKNDEEAIALLKYNKEFGQIPILKMINCSNEKEIKIPENKEIEELSIEELEKAYKILEDMVKEKIRRHSGHIHKIEDK